MLDRSERRELGMTGRMIIRRELVIATGDDFVNTLNIARQFITELYCTWSFYSKEGFLDISSKALIFDTESL